MPLSKPAVAISEVIHLVAVIRGGPRQFDAINRQGTANMVAAAKEAGSIRRFVHVSALGADNAPNGCATFIPSGKASRK